MTFSVKPFLATVAVIGLMGSAAFAADASDIRLLKETKITLTQAIAAAEKNLGGQALEASLDDDSFKPAYDVSIVKGDKVFDVQVDGVTGEVIGSREDIDD